MSNEVEIDRAALEAEAKAAIADLPPDETSHGDVGANSGGGAQPSPEGAELTAAQVAEIAQGYEPAALMLVSKACDYMVPAWRVTRDERVELSRSIAFALAAWFPDQQLPPKYVALIMVAGSAFTIVDARRNPETGELPPRKHHVPDAQAQTIATGSAGESARAGGGFSTSA